MSGYGRIDGFDLVEALVAALTQLTGYATRPR